MGSEGAFGVVTSVTVRVRRVPAVKVYETWRFASFDEGAAAMRTLAQGGAMPTVLRLSDEAETMVNLAEPDEVGSESPGGCLMVVGFEGEQAVVDARRDTTTTLLTGLGGTGLGEAGGAAWAKGRFHGPYLRDSMLDVGVLVETVETVTFWSRLRQVYDAVKQALESTLGHDGRPVLVLCHISHVYETGASLYFTIATRQDVDPVAQWRAAKAAASDAMIGNGASITHHHAVGQDHKPLAGRGDRPRGGRDAPCGEGADRPDGRAQPGRAGALTETGGMSTDWQAWHAPYADPDSDLSRRRRSVQRQITQWLDERDDDRLRVVSACAGDGRDLLEVLAARPDRERVTATLLELDEGLARAAEKYAAAHDLAVDVRRGDAGTTDSYAGAVPADLVQMCGVFGNVTDDDLRATIAALPQLCTPGATVIWTRGRFATGDLTGEIRAWFGDEGFEEVAFDAPWDAKYRVGTHRLVAVPRPLVPGQTFFRFIR